VLDMAIGDIIRERRETLALSQDQLAELVGVGGRRQINRWEKGEQDPTATNCRSLARVLGLSLPELFGEIPIGLDLSGTWFAAWDTTRDGVMVVDRHKITAQHRGGTFVFTADGDYVWSGSLRIEDGCLMGTYLSAEADKMYRGTLYFEMAEDYSAVIGKWSGRWADGIVGGEWGVLARDEDRAPALLAALKSHEGPLTEWPTEDT
jgi:transcriptional regulator with XRE-family HTH domain